MYYRWLTDAEVEAQVNPLCAARGWAQLNINPAQPTCRVRGAFSGDELVGFCVLQLMPLVGPLWVDTEFRSGEVSRTLTEQVHEFLMETGARGWLAVCDSPVSERLAARHGMEKLASPVYVAVKT